MGNFLLAMGAMGLDAVPIEGFDAEIMDDLVHALPQHDRWETMARAALRDELLKAHGELTSAVLADPSKPAAEQVDAWLAQTPGVEDKVATLGLVCEEPDVARVSVGVRLVRSLLPA